MASGSNRALAALAANRRVRRHGDAVSSPVLSRTTTPEPVTTPSSTNATPKNDTPTGPRTKQQYRTPPGTEAVSIRELKSLIEKTDHIDKYIKELEDKNSTIHSRKRLPRELSVSSTNIIKIHRHTCMCTCPNVITPLFWGRHRGGCACIIKCMSYITTTRSELGSVSNVISQRSGHMIA